MPTQSKRRIKSSPIVKPGSKKKSKLRELSSRKEDEDDDRQYMMLRHSPRQDEEQAAEEEDNGGGNDTSEKTHYIPKSPDGRSMITRSLRGRRAAANAAPSTASRQVSQHEAPPAQQLEEQEDEEVAVDDTTISQAASVLRGVSEDATSLTTAPQPPTPGGQTLHNLPSWRYQPSRSNLGEDLSIGPAPSWGSIGLGLGTFDYGDYNSNEPMELSAAAALAGYSPGTLLLNDQYVCGSSVITPATTIRKGMTSTGLYPPSSPIKASGSPKISEDGNDNGEELSGEWLPPREGQSASSSERREKVIAATVHVPPPPASEADKSKNAQPAPAYHSSEEVDPRYASSYIQPQFIRRQPSNTRSSNTHHTFYQQPHHAVYSPPRYHPSVVGASRSHSNDSSESPGHSLLNAGGRVQVVGGAHHEWDASPWSVVSRSRSAESSGSVGGVGGGLYSNEWEPPKPNRTPMAPNPGRPSVAAEYRGGDMRPPPPPSYHPEYDSYSPDKASSSSPYVGTPYHPSGYPGHGRPPSGSGYRRQYPPSSAYPPHHHHHPYSSYPPHQYYGGHLEDGNPDNAEPHPLLKNYNPHKDGIIRPQFQYVKKTKTAERRAAAAAATRKAVVQHGSGGVVGVDYVTPRLRRCRDPNEKAAAAAAMAAAAAVKFKKEKDAQSPPTTSDVKKEQDDKVEDEPSLKEPEAVTSLPFSEEELKTLGSGDDEDIPAAKRAATASVLALREAAGGSPVPPPKSASEVTFDITNPPDEPVIPPSTVPVVDSLTQMTENDVLCGRGGGTNSTIGNRHYRALVRDFQPTYLMALRREKPSMARSAVLIIRNRGGRFLRKDETDGRLYEVGDEKAEAKTSQALREGLDVRATKSAANALRGTTRSDGTKKRKNSSSSDEGSLKKTSKKLAEPVIKVPKHLPQPVVHSGQHAHPPGYRAPPHHPYYSRGPPPGHYYHGAPPPGYHNQWYLSHPGAGAPQFMRHGR